METLNTAFGKYIKDAMKLSKSSSHITEENVYQEGADDILPYLDKMVEYVILPGSGIEGIENLDDLYSKAESGKSCLLLLEHYSNMDLSMISYLLRNSGERGKKIGNSIVAIAGMKLNEDNPGVAALTSAYTRLVIYPSRSLQHLDPEKDRAEIVRSNSINRAAMKTLIRIKNKGRLILMFPSGTRYRPWDPSTKKGVREIDSFIRTFDYMCLVALNGQVLHVNQGDMLDDVVTKDVVRLSVSPVISCTEFRNKARGEDSPSTGQEQEDKKQAVADAIMEELERMHIEGEEKRKKLLP